MKNIKFLLFHWRRLFDEDQILSSVSLKLVNIFVHIIYLGNEDTLEWKFASNSLAEFLTS